jgi:hypothetical protein
LPVVPLDGVRGAGVLLPLVPDPPGSGDDPVVPAGGLLSPELMPVPEPADDASLPAAPDPDVPAPDVPAGGAAGVEAGGADEVLPPVDPAPPAPPEPIPDAPDWSVAERFSQPLTTRLSAAAARTICDVLSSAFICTPSLKKQIHGHLLRDPHGRTSCMDMYCSAAEIAGLPSNPVTHFSCQTGRS